MASNSVELINGAGKTQKHCLNLTKHVTVHLLLVTAFIFLLCAILTVIVRRHHTAKNTTSKKSFVTPSIESSSTATLFALSNTTAIQTLSLKTISKEGVALTNATYSIENSKKHSANLDPSINDNVIDLFNQTVSRKMDMTYDDKIKKQASEETANISSLVSAEIFSMRMVDGTLNVTDIDTVGVNGTFNANANVTVPVDIKSADRDDATMTKTTNATVATSTKSGYTLGINGYDEMFSVIKVEDFQNTTISTIDYLTVSYINRFINVLPEDYL